MIGVKKVVGGAALAGAMMFAGGVAPANAVVQDGLVNIAIGDVTVLEDVRVAAAATILANVCSNIPVTVNVLGEIEDVDAGEDAVFTCTARNGRTIAVTDNV